MCRARLVYVFERGDDKRNSVREDSTTDYIYMYTRPDKYCCCACHTCSRQHRVVAAWLCSWCMHASVPDSTHSWRRRHLASTHARTYDQRREDVQRIRNLVRPRRTPSTAQPAARSSRLYNTYGPVPTSSSALARATWRHLDRGHGRE